MPTQINLDTQISSAEFSSKVADSVNTSGAAKNSIATFVEFDVSNGHDHDGVNSKKVSWNNIDAKPTTFVPSPHDHNSHTNIGPDDHHNHLSAGYDIIPNSVSVSDFIECKEGTYQIFGNASDNIKLSYDSNTKTFTIESSNNSAFTINNTIESTYIQSSNIYIGSPSSNIDFSTSNINAQNWEISGQGYAKFQTINDITISPESENNNISGVTKFNGVKIEPSGTFSGIKVGNNLYQINHSSHEQNTDTGTNQATFTINYSQQNNIKIATDPLSSISSSEAAIVNDTSTDRALILMGNASRGTTNKKVRIYDDAEVQGDLIVQNNIIAYSNQLVATYHQNGTIRDNYASGKIQIGNTLIQWGVSSGNDWRTISFQQAFASNTTPSISCATADSSEAIYKTRNITNNSFELNGVDDSFNSVNCTLTWLAIGSA